MQRRYPLAIQRRRWQWLHRSTTPEAGAECRCRGEASRQAARAAALHRPIQTNTKNAFKPWSDLAVAILGFSERISASPRFGDRWFAVAVCLACPPPFARPRRIRVIQHNQLTQTHCDEAASIRRSSFKSRSICEGRCCRLRDRNSRPVTSHFPTCFQP